MPTYPLLMTSIMHKATTGPVCITLNGSLGQIFRGMISEYCFIYFAVCKLHEYEPTCRLKIKQKKATDVADMHTGSRIMLGYTLKYIVHLNLSGNTSK